MLKDDEGSIDLVEMRPAIILSKNINALRKANGMSQLDLSQKSGVGIATIQRIEGAHVDYPAGSTLKKLADALGVKKQDLENEHLAVEDQSDQKFRKPKAKREPTPGENINNWVKIIQVELQKVIDQAPKNTMEMLILMKIRQNPLLKTYILSILSGEEEYIQRLEKMLSVRMSPSEMQFLVNAKAILNRVDPA